MPYGPLQSVQIIALASGSLLAGAFSMFCFSIGTVPLMLGFGSAIAFETLYGTGIEGGFDFNCGHGAFNGDTGNCAGWTEFSADIPDGRHRFTDNRRYSS